MFYDNFKAACERKGTTITAVLAGYRKGERQYWWLENGKISTIGYCYGNCRISSD